MVTDIIGYFEMRPDKKAALLLLNAEKAFDKVPWKFMHKTIKTMKLGEKNL